MFVFVEYESEVVEEKVRFKMLFNKFRIDVEILVFWFVFGDFLIYEIII